MSLPCWCCHLSKKNVSRIYGRTDSRAPLLLRRQGLVGSQGLLPPDVQSCIGLTATTGWAYLVLDRRSLVPAPNAPRDQSQHPRACSDYDEETAYDSCMNPEPGSVVAVKQKKGVYESYMNPEPGFQSGPGDSANAD